MDPENTALSALAEVGGKLLGGLDITKFANAGIDRRARLLEDRTTKEINADAAATDFDLATIEVRTKLKLAIGDSAVAAIAESNPILLQSLAKSWEYAEREQWNVGKVLVFTAGSLTPDEPGSAPSDEWLHHFVDGAKFMSDDDLRSLWGRVLAQEIRQTGTVSKRTLGVLKTMDKKTALAFQRLRSQAIGFQRWHGISYAVPATHYEKDKDDRFVADFRTRELMRADGLLDGTETGRTVIMNEWTSAVEYQRKVWILKPAGPRIAEHGETVSLECFPFGLTGNEIASAIDITPDQEHETRLINYLASKRVSLIPLPSDCNFGEAIPEEILRVAIDR